MAKKKIFFLINSLAMGGSERVITEYARQLSKYSNVKIVLLRDANDFKLSIPIIKLSRLKGKKAYFLMWPLLRKRLTRLITEEKPDMIVSFLEYSNLLNIASCEKARREKSFLRTKCIISVRANPSYVYHSGLYGALFSWLIRKNYQKADLVIVNSKLSKKDLCSNFHVAKDKVKVVYNPVDTRRIEMLSRNKLDEDYEELYSGNYKIIISVGRLTYLKGQDHLIQAFGMLKQECKEAKLVLVGDGELKAKLEKLAVKLGIKNDVHFLGDQKNPFKYVARSDVFAFTSLYEGFPNAVVEALACHTPVVSVDCRSGPREIIAPETSADTVARKIEFAEYGILVPPFGYNNNPSFLKKRQSMLKDAILKVINDKKLQKKYAINGIKRARELDTVKMTAEFYMAITEEIT